MNSPRAGEYKNISPPLEPRSAARRTEIPSTASFVCSDAVLPKSQEVRFALLVLPHLLPESPPFHLLFYLS